MFQYGVHTECRMPETVVLHLVHYISQHVTERPSCKGQNMSRGCPTFCSGLRGFFSVGVPVASYMVNMSKSVSGPPDFRTSPAAGL